VAGDEDPKLATLRAQAVGSALIALGAKPSRLRAKGYGAMVALTPASSAGRLELPTRCLAAGRLELPTR